MYAHFMQHSVSDCGIASVKTIMKQLKIELPNDDELYNHYSIENSDGLSLETVIQILKHYGVESKAYELNSFKKILSVVNFPILLVTEMDGLNHYIVLHERTRNNIYIISDPSKGQIEYYSEEELERIFSGYILCVTNFDTKNGSSILKRFSFLQRSRDKKKLSDIIYHQCLNELNSINKLKITLSIVFKHFIPLSCLFILQNMTTNTLIPVEQHLIFLTLSITFLSISFTFFSRYEAKKKVLLENIIQEKILMKYYCNKMDDVNLNEKIENISGYFWNLFTSVSGLLDKFYLRLNMAFVIILVILTAITSPHFFLILFFWIFVFLVYLYNKSDQIKKTEREIVNKSTKFSYAVESNLRSNLDINIFSKKKEAEAYVRRTIHSYFESKQRVISNDIEIYTTYQIFSFFALLSVAFLYILRISDSSMTNELANESNGILMMSVLINAISPVIQHWLSYQKSSVAIDHIQSVNDYNNEFHEKPNKQIMVDTIDKLEIMDLNFSYENSEKLVLKKSKLVFQSGNVYSIIGPNGSGKSTLVKLLTGSLSPNSGRIVINDKLQMNTLEGTDIMKYLGLYTPEFYIYANSIVRNINFRVFDETIDDNTYQDILGLDLPSSYQIEDSGTNLSQGQQQKILLMRSLKENRSIYVFDEPTSNLDEESKKRFLSKVTELRELNKIVIIVTHEAMVQEVSDYIVDLNNSGGTN